MTRWWATGLALVVGCAHRAPAPVAPVELKPSLAVQPQVAAVDPPVVTAFVPTTVLLRGSRFEFGGTVEIGGDEVRSRVDDDGLIRVAVPELAAGEYDVVVLNPSGQVGTLLGGLAVEQRDVAACDAVTVAFPEELTRLEPAAMEALRSLAWCWDARGEAVVVHGLATERLPVESALALSYGRAAAAAAALEALGVPRERVVVVAFGAEAVAAPAAGVEIVASSRPIPRYGVRYGPFIAE